MYFHALPDHWETMEYEDFLSERRLRMANVVRDAYRKLSQGAAPTAVSCRDADRPIDPTLVDLLEAGVLTSGDLLDPVDPSWEVDAVISADGTLVLNGTETFDSLDAAAKHLGVTNIPGLDFWALERPNELISLRQLATA